MQSSKMTKQVSFEDIPRYLGSYLANTAIIGIYFGIILVFMLAIVG